MFNKDFYPTLPETIEDLVQGLDLEGKNILDPESGKGDILKACKLLGAVTYGCEIQPELYEASKLYGQMIGYDFMKLTREDVAHMDAIIMNPPFSADIRHIKHAWEVAPDGCVIRALCNADTLKVDRFAIKRLLTIIEENNGIILQLGQCFTTAERKTNVNVAMISLIKPEGEKEDWDSYFSRENVDEQHAPGLMKANVIDEIVGRYVGSLKKFDSVLAVNKEIEDIMGPINVGGISFGCTQRNERGQYNTLGYEEFKKALQKSAWKLVFLKMNMTKFMTRKLKEKITTFVEEEVEKPFTVENIYNMLKFIASTNAGRMEEVLIEVFDEFTKHYDENRHNVEGWKTNSHYMINQKIIIPNIVSNDYGHLHSYNYDRNEKIDDLTKSLCFITGTNWDDIGHFETWIRGTYETDLNVYLKDKSIITKGKWYYKERCEHHNPEFSKKFKKKFPTEESYIENHAAEECEKKTLQVKREFGKWYTWGFFEIKGFKKGTLHMKFIDPKVCELFNLRVAEAKGFELPDSVLSKETQAKRQENPAKPLIKLI